ncbi:hypothetical protein BVG16_24540 [Paenibacillus selenitireducens]|uniref:Threonine/Serine exporter ThrE domain-containing protein n=1 Tax=Paenibacillus selenitireducens TaxID=1324314 RepID=A0A1T2X321_9BACL|nr:threonine/serine exporter family protein [Paenibacillus selenitireducens]OPA74298.1 hypothetical protein BVG16_24540 [Paenibacillus selenitireducens]
MIAQLITSFIASAAFGVIFNAPRRALPQCGFVGMVSWGIYVLMNASYSTVLASLVATFIVGATSIVFARLYKTPVIIFSVSGIIPLVPGGLAYDAMRHFVQNDNIAALQLAAQAFFISGAIAIGLVIAEVLNQMLRKLATKLQ